MQVERHIVVLAEIGVAGFVLGHGNGTFAANIRCSSMMSLSIRGDIRPGRHKNDYRRVKPRTNCIFMTLREFFDYLSANPAIVMLYFLCIPFTAFLAGILGKGEGHLAPWKYLYATLIYLVCVPGIFAAALAVYLFLFERGGSILNVNLLTQVLPIVSMVVTLGIIRRNTPFEYIPGFGKLSSLMLMIASVFVLMYFLDRLHLVAWVNVPVLYLLLIVGGLLLAFRYALKSFIS